MKPTSFDSNVRIVSLANLTAMCERLSGTCHRFTVEQNSAARVRVNYSNPDEYGNAHPVAAEFALLPLYGKENPAVVLSALRYIGCKDYEEQAFDQLYDMEQLWPYKTGWATEYEILVEKYPAWKATSTWDKAGCVQTWHCNGSEFKDYRKAQAFAVYNMRTIQAETAPVKQQTA